MSEMTDSAPPPPPGDWTPPPGGWPPPAGWPPPPSAPIRVLRRSTTDRVGAGVCGGLGEYFGLDPVIFRVLFATTAFFGIGVVAYLFAWIVIPDAGANNPPVDRFIGELRRRGVPLWLVVTVGLFLAWVVLASWWSPWPLVPVALAAVALVIAFNKSKPSANPPYPPPVGFPTDPSAASVTPPAPTVPTAAGFAAEPGFTQPLAFEPPPVPPAPRPSEFSNWINEARAARRHRRQRNLPVRIGTWAVWFVAVAVISIVDAVNRVPMSVYVWTSLGVVVASLIVGAALRRPAFGFSLALVPIIILLLAFGGTRASLHDGAGDYTYSPTSAGQLQSHYRAAFGRTTLDLSGLAPLTADRTVQITQAAGQVRVMVPSNVSVAVISDVHIGSVELDHENRRGGVNFNDQVTLNSGAGSTLTVNVNLSDGDVSIIRTH